jgi:hypothetical protein
MSDKPMSIQPPNTVLSWAKSPEGIFEVYANAMHVTWTQDDVRIRLGQVVDDPNTPNPGAGFRGINEERAAVTFPWRYAKSLRNQLTNIIERYEKANGPINLDIKLPAGD